VGPRRIEHQLGRLGTDPLPSRSAIYRCLKRHGLIELRRRRRRRDEFRRWEREGQEERTRLPGPLYRRPVSKLGRPRVITHNVSSLDGRLGLPGVLLLQGDKRWSAIGGGDAITDAWALHEPQVQLEGSNSFVPRDAAGADLPPAPAGVDLHAHFLPRDIVTSGRCFFVVVDSRGRVRWTQKVGQHEEHLMILVSELTPSSYLAFLRDEAIPYLVAGTDRVDLPRALELLRVHLGVTTLVATGGGLLNGALLRVRVVDEVDIDFIPAIIGGGGAPMLFDGAPLGPEETAAQLTPIVVQQKPNGGIFVRYAVGYAN
jgi:2,5-diamino-6-(ribosylamino)-4(3H)-pyrimidinone 5'-phosphate reductase